MKLGTAIASIVMISAVALSGAQGKPAKPANMKLVPQATMSKADWQKMYDKAAIAFEKMDTNGIFSYMAPGFTMTMAGHTMTTEQAKGQMKAWFSMMKTMHCKFTVTKVSGVGGMALVTDDFSQGGVTKPNPKTKKSDRYADVGTEQATWIKVNGKWMMKKLVMIKENMTMNGKPFNPSMSAK